MKINDDRLVEHAKWSFRLADQCMSKLDREVIGGVQGQAGAKNLCLMNNLCSIDGLNYLEIGLFNGLTFCCSLYGNSVNAIGIDDWSEFGGSRETFDRNIERFVEKNSVMILQDDCFADSTIHKCADALGDEKVNIYLYDAGHSFSDHYCSLAQYDDILEDTFVLVVDDWQQLDVQRGTLFALRDLGYKILWENHCRSVNDDVENWWCGSYLAVLSKRR